MAAERADLRCADDRLFGLVAGEDLSLPFAVELARQDDYGNNPQAYDANYLLFEAGISVPGLITKLGYEVLEGSAAGTGRFITPLATLHKFQGWTDRFPSTPPAGIEDSYLSLQATVLGAAVTLVYHDFSAEATSASYGDEWDVSLGRRFGRVNALLKFASYRANGFATDTDKVWLMLSATF